MTGPVRKNLRQLDRWLKRAVAAAVLLVAIIARIPSPHCHCHESPRKQSTSSECPFKLLRQIANTVAVATPDLNLTTVEAVYQVEFSEPLLRSLQLAVTFNARAPPLLPIAA
jgi:hypothetical protein